MRRRRRDFYWTEERREELREKARRGMTLQQIADEIGVSRQRAAQLTGAVRPMREWNKTYSVYQGIDNWMKYNRVTYVMLGDMLGYAPGASSSGNLARRLMGEVMLSKDLIDDILEVTGMTYEEAFKERKENSK